MRLCTSCRCWNTFTITYYQRQRNITATSTATSNYIKFIIASASYSSTPSTHSTRLSSDVVWLRHMYNNSSCFLRSTLWWIHMSRSIDTWKCGKCNVFTNEILDCKQVFYVVVADARVSCSSRCIQTCVTAVPPSLRLTSTYTTHEYPLVCWAVFITLLPEVLFYEIISYYTSAILAYMHMWMFIFFVTNTAQYHVYTTLIKCRK